MILAAGSRLGPYEILAPLGAGGMGEVYRARDTRLDRIVAIKVASEQFSERFEREARAVAAFNHPHICQLYDVGPNYIVMEYIDGQPLKGPLPLDQALKYGAQICDALDAAHRKSFTHRDLKPANIMVTRSGVKLLDFGLAKRSRSAAADDATETVPLTKANTILGTLQYMSPEQLHGKDADARSDIFAFGAVLYEMVTGKRAFEGESQASVIAAILDRDPAPLSPQPLERVVTKCLAKDPERRWQSARDLKDELEWIADSGTPATIAPARNKWHGRSGWILAATFFGAGLFHATSHWRSGPAGELVRFQIHPPDKTAFSGPINVTVPVPQFALSPDGHSLVFAAAAPGASRMLWLRPTEEVAARPLPGTENAQDPFWSPDSRWIAFFSAGKLHKMPAAGGTLQVIAEGVFDSRGGSWGTDNTILFETGYKSILRVSSAGGTVTTVTNPDNSRQEVAHRWPQILPGGRHFLLTVLSGTGGQSGVYAASFDGKTKKFLVQSPANALYASPGYLLFMAGDTLLGQAFDPERLELSGQAFTIAKGVGRSTGAYGAFSVSGAGARAYSGPILRLGRLTWFDRDGKLLHSAGTEGDYIDFRLSPDEKRLASSIVDTKAGTPDVWLIDLARGDLTRLTFGDAVNTSPLWSPDGARIVFRRYRNGVNEFYQRSSAGGGAEEAVLQLGAQQTVGLKSPGSVPTDWSADGQRIIFSVSAPGGSELWMLPLKGAQKPVKFRDSPHDEMHANFSPDGRLVAYTSNESGRFEVFVQTVPLSDRKWPVSTNGGYEPRWRADGREVFYLSDDRKLMAVPVGAGPSFGIPKALFQTRAPSPSGMSPFRANYVPSRDGRRFLVNTQSDNTAPNPITVVLNWNAGLK